MTSRRLRSRRLLLPILLAAVLVGEVTGLALARSLTPPADPAAPSNAVQAGATVGDADRTAEPARAIERIADAARELSAVRFDPVARPPIGRLGPGVVPASPAGKASASTASASAASKTAPPPTSASYRGKNRVWIPSLGINRAVSPFPCSRTRPPDNDMYRWGCAGRNNVYLLGHSYSVFKPLHDAYVGGRLEKGMKVIYADGAGRVHTYSVIWWRVVKPTTAASWAWAAQARPSMTLQTCVGARSEHRLMVRLVRVG